MVWSIMLVCKYKFRIPHTLETGDVTSARVSMVVKKKEFRDKIDIRTIKMPIIMNVCE